MRNHSEPARSDPMSSLTSDLSAPDLRDTSGCLLFDGVEELDAVGPWEVLAYWTQQHPEDGWTISCLSAGGADVTGAKGLVLGAHHSLDDAPALDVLIHPGGRAPGACCATPSTWTGCAHSAPPSR